MIHAKAVPRKDFFIIFKKFKDATSGIIKYR
jgi:hypothetical protein